MPELRRPSTRMAIVGGVLAAVIIVLIIIVATSGDDGDPAPLVIQSPATVTGITGVTAESEPGEEALPTGVADTSSTADAVNTHPLVRTFDAVGTLDCTTVGEWQPFAEIQITFSVGQPDANATCGDNVLDLPQGYCATECTEVPPDWHVVEKPGVSPQALMMIVAPTDVSTTTAQLICVQDFVPQKKQILPVATSIDQACATGTSNSVEIPYVPPVTSDIPYEPPPVSVDIPTSSS